MSQQPFNQQPRSNMPPIPPSVVFPTYDTTPFDMMRVMSQMMSQMTPPRPQQYAPQQHAAQQHAPPQPTPQPTTPQPSSPYGAGVDPNCIAADTINSLARNAPTPGTLYGVIHVLERLYRNSAVPFTVGAIVKTLVTRYGLTFDGPEGQLEKFCMSVNTGEIIKINNVPLKYFGGHFIISHDGEINRFRPISIEIASHVFNILNGLTIDSKTKFKRFISIMFDAINIYCNTSVSFVTDTLMLSMFNYYRAINILTERQNISITMTNGYPNMNILPKPADAAPTVGNEIHISPGSLSDIVLDTLSAKPGSSTTTTPVPSAQPPVPQPAPAPQPAPSAQPPAPQPVPAPQPAPIAPVPVIIPPVILPTATPPLTSAIVMDDEDSDLAPPVRSAPRVNNRGKKRNIIDVTGAEKPPAKASKRN